MWLLLSCAARDQRPVLLLGTHHPWHVEGEGLALLLVFSSISEVGSVKSVQDALSNISSQPFVLSQWLYPTAPHRADDWLAQEIYRSGAG